MKYFISIDMEGIWGTSNFFEPQDRVSRLMTDELNHTIKMLRKFDPDARIRVCDSHGLGTNVLPEEVEPYVELVRGFPRTYYMMEGLDETFDAVLFIGYHAPVGYRRGAMSHTYSSSSFFEIRINGISVGEAEINAIFASLFKLPVIFISGDSALYEFSGRYFPKTEFLITKDSIGHNAVLLRNKEEVYIERSNLIERAVQKLKDGSFKSFLDNNPKFLSPYKLEIELKDTLRADLVSIMPHSKRESGRIVEYYSSDFREVYRFIVASSLIAWQANHLR